MIFRQIQPRTPADFVAFMLADLPAPPEGHLAIRAANRRGNVPGEG